MKILFMAPVQAKATLEKNYRFIVAELTALGHTVDSTVLFGTTSQDLDQWEGTDKIDALERKITHQIKTCDIFVTEITSQRISTGYWLTLALELGKPTIALHVKGEKHHLLKTLEATQKFTLFEYTSLEQLGEELPLLVKFAAEQQDTRFNFFISPKHQSYLDWISKHKKTPRSVYLRNLIEEDMQKSPFVRE